MFKASFGICAKEEFEKASTPWLKAEHKSGGILSFAAAVQAETAAAIFVQ